MSARRRASRVRCARNHKKTSDEGHKSQVDNRMCMVGVAKSPMLHKYSCEQGMSQIALACSFHPSSCARGNVYCHARFLDLRLSLLLHVDFAIGAHVLAVGCTDTCDLQVAMRCRG